MLFQSTIERYITYTEKNGFNMKQKLLLFKELGYLLGWGVGINEAIQVIASDWDTAAQRYIWGMIGQALLEGKTLTNALARLPDYFSPSDVAIVKAGESSWNLVTVLRNLAQEYSFLNTLENKFIWAVTYPIVLLVIAIAAVLVLFTTILPGIFSIATQFPGVTLPTITRVMMGASTFLQTHISSLFITIWLLLFLFSIVLSSTAGRAYAFRFVLGIPSFGIIVRNYYIVKLMRYFKLLHQSGMNYVDVLVLLRDIMGTWPYQDMVETMLQYVRRGELLYKGTVLYPYLLPSNASVLLKVGEATAQLPETMQHITDMYEEDLLMRIATISKIIEPILIVLLGIVVMLIAFSVFGIITTILWGVQGG